MTSTLYSAAQTPSQPPYAGTAGTPATPLRLNITRGRRLALIVLGGDLDAATAPRLTGAVQQLADSGLYRHVTINASEIRFVDLHGLRALDDNVRLVTSGRRRMTVAVIPGRALLRLRSRFEGLQGVWT